MPKSSADHSAAKPYAAPTLKIYGDVTKLTAGGTGAEGITTRVAAMESNRAWARPLPTTMPTVNISSETKMKRLKMTAISR